MHTITDQYLFLYCLLLANNPDMQLTFDELIEECDNDSVLMKQFQEFLTKEIEKQSAFLTKETDSKKKA